MADALRGGLIINEIHPQPVVSGGGGYDTDQNGSVAATDEFVEFHNISDSAIDMSGLQLWDPGVGNWFTFPQGSVLPAGGFAILVTNIGSGGSLPQADLAFSAGRPGALMNNLGDNIILHDPVAGEFTVTGYGDWPLVDPQNPVNAPAPVPGLATFPTGSVQIGEGEHFGPLIPGQSIQRIPNGGDVFDNATPPTPGAANLCFVSGAMIRTPDGPRRVETLTVGDKVCTASGGVATLRWVGLRRMEADALQQMPQLWPIAFEADALGPGLPGERLLLSPHHRVLVSGPIARRMFGTNEVLVAAKEFLELSGVSRELPAGTFFYVHLMTDSHDIVLANGVAAETLYLGKVTRDSLPPASLVEILAIFPDLAAAGDPPSARVFAGGRSGRHLIRRHQQNGKALQQVS
ncbi:Hint domain-containing protein [Paracoccus shanxieyensis]|uniref:LTD domain-containing protein n=1 Tax=Paracoccus shanxieyensis TaxID=2675752 RepID=A0A6L6IYZ7_9RHOB|nr:Hint domain-containing protein [Paracoccus shanxieyensis]MTH64320.1 hypothetical protein [Paracoccus shanxieyensis]MTH87464.1 hypothetical protein [Paracoccus shanxieyensis]